MIIPDTSIWIEFFRANEPVFERLAEVLRRGDAIGLPWIFGELLQGARGEAELKVLKRTWKSLPKPEAGLLERAWLIGGEASQRGKWIARGIGLIDAAIVAVAEELQTNVWTLDKHLLSLLRSKKLCVS